MNQSSRRGFLKGGATAVAVSVSPLHQALAGLQTERQTQPPGWRENGNFRFRQDGIPKVTGDKVFAVDIRARDMPDWPDEQAHAFLIRVPRADRVFEGVTLDPLGEELRPDAVVTAETLRNDGVEMVEPDFYGAFFLEEGNVPAYLAQDMPEPSEPLSDPEAIDEHPEGHRLYVGLCAGCHGTNGSGQAFGAVAMVGNTTLMLDNPLNLQRVIRERNPARQLGGHLRMQEMPAFDATLAEAELEDLSGYPRARWGVDAMQDP